jgi:ubiquinone biosynthesis protein
MTHYLNHILFLFRIFSIFVSELFLFFIFKDYETFIERITQRFAKINILCVKVFQAFALNNKIIDENINNKLLAFTDKAPWSYSDIDYNSLLLLEEEYNLDFCSNYNPINSGMISLVFKAKHKENGKPLIVKLKRNNIEKKLEKAISEMIFIMNVLSFAMFLKKYDLTNIIKKNIDIITHQINFIEEVENMNRIKENCKNLKYVKIPNSYKEVTDKYNNVILMDMIDGVTINNVDKDDYDGFAKQVLKFGFVTTILHGVTHGDLHSGNILFIKDENDAKYKYKIGILDFGIIYEIDNKYKEVLFDIITQLFNLEPIIIANKILKSGVIEPMEIIENMPREHYNNLTNMLANIVEDVVYKSKEANQMQIFKFLNGLKEYMSQNELLDLGLRPSDNFVKTQLVLAMAHGVTLTLCKDNYMEIANNVINDLFHVNFIGL